MPDRRKSTAPPPPTKEQMLFELRRKARQRAEEEYQARFRVERPPAAVPPVVDPAAWEKFPAFRETLLLRYANPEHNAALRAVGNLIFDLSVECGGAPIFHELAAAAADLRHLQGFLYMVEEEKEGADPRGSKREVELVRLARLAGRVSRRIAKLAAAIEQALAPEAGAA